MLHFVTGLVLSLSLIANTICEAKNIERRRQYNGAMNHGTRIDPTQRRMQGPTSEIISVTRELVDFSLVAANGTSAIPPPVCGNFTGTIVVSHPITMRADKKNFNIAQKQMTAMEMIVGYINQERCGILVGGQRHSLVLKSYSDGADKEQVELISESTVGGTDFFFGPYSSGLTGILTPVAQREGKLVLAAGAASTSVFAGKPLAFGNLPPAASYLTEAIRGLAQVGAKTIASFHESAGFTIAACNQVSTLASDNGMVVTSSTEVPTSPVRSDLAPLAKRYRDEENPDVVVSCVYNAGCREWIQTMRKANWAPKAQVFTICVGDDLLTNELGADLYGIIGVAPWDKSEQATDFYTGWNASEFGARFEVFSNLDATYHAASAAASVVILADAIEQANSTDGQAVANVLNEAMYETFYGVISFDDNGQVANKSLGIQYDENVTVQTVFPVERRSASVLYPMVSWAYKDCINSDCKQCNSDGTCVAADTGNNTAVIAAVSIVGGILLLAVFYLTCRLHKVNSSMYG